MQPPFARYRMLSPWLVSLSVVLTAALTLFEAGRHLVLWSNWATAGVISLIVSRSITYLNLQSRSELRAYAIIWPFVTAGLQFAYCHFAHPAPFLLMLPQLLLVLLVIGFTLSLWQRRRAPTKGVILGLTIGVLSAFSPAFILLAPLFPVLSAVMRCWSVRNYLCVLTGALFSLWVIYAGGFLLADEAWANAFIMQYAAILRPADVAGLLSALGLWQYLYLAFTLLLLFFYTLSGYFLNASMSVRTAYSIKVISVISVVAAMLMVLGGGLFYASFALLSMLVAVQLTVHQAHIRSAAHEWCIITLIVLYSLLCLLPIFV